jgi:chromosome partitioning protein
MLHQRVDFAASMVDGRTVGEITPQSPSAKEVGALWVYVQDRLARIVHDASLRPVARGAELAVTPLSAMEPERESAAPKAAPVFEPEPEDPFESAFAPLPASAPEPAHNFAADLPPPPAPPPPFLHAARAEAADDLFGEPAREDHSAPVMNLPEAQEPMSDERRAGLERRKFPPFFRPFGTAAERRAHPFGRRHTDPPLPYTSAK